MTNRLHKVLHFNYFVISRVKSLGANVPQISTPFPRLSACNLNPSNRFTSCSSFLNCAVKVNFPPFPLFNAATSADMFFSFVLRVVNCPVCITCSDFMTKFGKRVF